jgi:hypothetical protein
VVLVALGVFLLSSLLLILRVILLTSCRWGLIHRLKLGELRFPNFSIPIVGVIGGHDVRGSGGRGIGGGVESLCGGIGIAFGCDFSCVVGFREGTRRFGSDLISGKGITEWRIRYLGVSDID